MIKEKKDKKEKKEKKLKRANSIRDHQDSIIYIYSPMGQ